MNISNASEKKLNLAIIGQGYVGLPLALLFCDSGCIVQAIDVDPTKIDKLQDGQSYIKHIGSKRVQQALSTGQFFPSTDFSSIQNADAVLICVPTPLDEHHQPDMSYVVQTAESIAPHLQPDSVVILESTAYPGATEGVLREHLEAKSGLTAGSDFHLAFSPEREDPGNPLSEVKKIPKLVGGLTEACRDKAIEVYSCAVDHLVPVSSCKVAEATKLTENIFRSVNIALVNELKVIYAKMGIDIWEVIEAAKTKPFGFMPFYPGPGLGGHCIPIDPFYLSWSAKGAGIATRFIELAGEINEQMPDYVFQRLTEALNHSEKSVNGAHILVVGMAYKKNVDDMRESPALRVFDQLQKSGAQVAYYDPYIPEIPPTREFAHLSGVRSVDWNAESLSKFDAAVIVTAHDDLDYTDLLNEVGILVDSRNALDGLDARDQQVWKA
jgi:UDP-N-acetyl-D-glucosamine dehydrogenase